ncbi:hypothetical protein [Cohnella soli]|uniref:Uncharacterized protein n=1 Tax=Cohnella soli TaxID=425005 RepID=A0ABW0I0V4_9BACL
MKTFRFVLLMFVISMVFVNAVTAKSFYYQYDDNNQLRQINYPTMVMNHL